MLDRLTVSRTTIAAVRCMYSIERSISIYRSSGLRGDATILTSVFLCVSGFVVDAGRLFQGERPAGLDQDTFILRQFSTETPPSSRRR